MITRKLTFPAPRRCWSPDLGGWSSHEWTLADVDEALSGGAFFLPNHHDFADLAAARRAVGATAEAVMEATE